MSRCHRFTRKLAFCFNTKTSLSTNNHKYTLESHVSSTRKEKSIQREKTSWKCHLRVEIKPIKSKIYAEREPKPKWYVPENFISPRQ